MLTAFATLRSCAREAINTMAPDRSKPIKSSFLGTFTLVFVAIAAFFVIDTFLEKTEQAESQAEAARFFREGQAQMQQGHSGDAVRQFQAALSIARGNRDYELALAQALVASGRLADAEAAVSELLQHDSTDGAANLILARILAGQGSLADAISYYHRAIYGHWKQDAGQNRVKARFELVDLLAKHNSKEELLAELLPLEEEASENIATRERVGNLFLAAGSPARAANVFHGILNDHPQNADAYAGLGEAEFASGNYRSALTDFVTASRVDPDNAAIRKRVDMSNQVLSLDPTRRGLDSDERYRRSAKLLGTILDDVNQCIGPNPTQTLQEVMDSARQALKHRVGASRQAAAIDTNLDLAEQLWQSRKTDCKQAVAESEQPLALVLAKVAQ